MHLANNPLSRDQYFKDEQAMKEAYDLRKDQESYFSLVPKDIVDCIAFYVI